MSNESGLRGQIWAGQGAVLSLEGSEVLDFLHRLSTQDLKGKLSEDSASATTAFTTAQGKLVEWCRVYRQTETRYLILCHQSRGTQLHEWIEKYIIIEDVEVTDVSDAYLYLEFGEQSSQRFEDLGAEAIRLSPPIGSSIREEMLYPKSGSESARLKDAATGTPMSREVLRILSGEPSPHFEYHKDTNPLELNLLHDAIGWNAGCYIGQEVISRLDSYDKVARGIMGFEFNADAELAPQPGDKLSSEDGKSIGRVTSVAVDEKLGGLGLALVGRQWTAGTALRIVTDKGELAGKLVDRSFGQKT